MAGTVGSGDAGSIQAEHNRKAMQGDVVHHLVPGARQEGGIDRHNGAQAGHRHSCGCGHRMLLGDAHIEDPFGVQLLQRE